MTVGPRQVGAGDGYVPPTDALTEPWWDATRERRLLLPACRACGAVHWYPRPLCPACGSLDLGWLESPGAGVIDTFTEVHRAPRADLEVPYAVARIRLDEGVVMLGRVDGAQPAIGQRVSLEWQPLPDGRAVPTFRNGEG